MAKKKRKRSTPSQGPNKQEIRAQRLEVRRQAKLEAEARRIKQARREKLVRYAILAFIVLSLFWFIFLRNQMPTEINDNPITQFSNAGVNNHTNETVSYETRPPVSGEHAPGAPPCGLYSQTIPDESQVHMLEHGAVGVQYRPDLELEEIKKIEEIVSDYDVNVFAAPYTDMETAIAVSSWSRKMELGEVDEESIRGYIDAFAGKGPESGQTCPMDSESPFEPAPSPSPEAVPGDEEEQGGGGGSGGGDGAEETDETNNGG